MYRFCVIYQGFNTDKKAMFPEYIRITGREHKYALGMTNRRLERHLLY